MDDGDSGNTVLAPGGADPVASLRCWPVTVALGGREWTIPALPAADWLEVLLAGELDGIFPGLVPDEGAQRWLDDALWAGDITVEELGETIRATIAVASGRTWWFTLNLLGAIRQAWDKIGGELALSGLDPGVVPLARWVDGAYLVCLRACRPESVGQFVDALNLPPVGAGVVLDEDSESAAFLAAMGQV